MFELTNDEVIDLLDYFYNRAGYISYESDLRLHSLIKRLYEYVEKQEIEETSEIEQRSEKNKFKFRIIRVSKERTDTSGSK